ncbi:MAG: glycosyl hydrolase 115 family protein [Oscillospiraceae bacterium]|jgi:hypothetical protein|nr:glycosyl hydrolase 115 family protein [Oscillospiraceae bacterium]
MNNFTFTVEPESYEGVKRIAGKVAADFTEVGGAAPRIASELPSGEGSSTNIIFSTLGRSGITDKLIAEGEFDPSAIRGKREVYQIKILGGGGLLICGSDKRGTIYGMFALSEYIGVSPLCYWGDVKPVKREIAINRDIETISKEPSVRYRGFFINDEWPCFGNWAVSRFGGFTAEMYERVFELLLRLKGNYLWPAMWTSSFPLDGPGNLSEELADVYGVVMGTSHHEPCLRASEEWDLARGENSEYGDEWNYYVNKGGLLKYWEDALIRSGKYEKIITIGMRGERDSSMLGENSSLKDNIDLLKDIIANQRGLIEKHADGNPLMIALYKEVEEYFYGNAEVSGLKDWGGLDGVICMLCEDNFGFMRTLPTEEIRSRVGGFGMYYHFDYHGGPISYEWLPSTSLLRTWEQMSMAYDYGVREVWVVNVGDLKFNEIPLSYFMELAYNFEEWGTKTPLNTGSIGVWSELFFKKTFPSVSSEIRAKMSAVLQGYMGINSSRRPEALNAETYHPCHYNDADTMLICAEMVEGNNEAVYAALSGNEKDAYYSLVYYPAKASVNLLRMNLYAGKNAHYAKQGKKIADKYAELVTRCIEKDRVLAEEFAGFNGGKWRGMELEQHIGFTDWNEDGCRYPLRIFTEPFHKPRMVVSRADGEEIYRKAYGAPMKIEVHDFLYEGNHEVVLEIANDGTGGFDYTIEADGDYGWLEISAAKGAVEFQEEVILTCVRENLPTEPQTARLLIKDGETVVAVEVKAKRTDLTKLPPATFLQNNGVTAMEYYGYCGKKDANGAGFVELNNYGMKVFPTTADFSETDDAPELTYRFLIEESGDYTVEVWTVPTNSAQNNRALRFTLTADDCENSENRRRVITAIPSDFRAGSPSCAEWCQGVLDNIRKSRAEFRFGAGVRELTIGALEAGLVLERVLIYKKGELPLKSYLGPPESFMIRNAIKQETV